MRIFGPKYPSPLQGVVNHAERFCALLARLERIDGPRSALARAWLCGRSEEVEALLTWVVADWSRGHIDLQAAASEAASYLASVHEGVRDCFAFDPTLECCAGDLALTVLAFRPEATARAVVQDGGFKNGGETVDELVREGLEQPIRQSARLGVNERLVESALQDGGGTECEFVFEVHSEQVLQGAGAAAGVDGAVAGSTEMGPVG